MALARKSGRAGVGRSERGREPRAAHQSLRAPGPAARAFGCSYLARANRPRATAPARRSRTAARARPHGEPRVVASTPTPSARAELRPPRTPTGAQAHDSERAAGQLGAHEALSAFLDRRLDDPASSLDGAREQPRRSRCCAPPVVGLREPAPRPRWRWRSGRLTSLSPRRLNCATGTEPTPAPARPMARTPGGRSACAVRPSAPGRASGRPPRRPLRKGLAAGRPGLGGRQAAERGNAAAHARSAAATLEYLHEAHQGLHFG